MVQIDQSTANITHINTWLTTKRQSSSDTAKPDLTDSINSKVCNCRITSDKMTDK